MKNQVTILRKGCFAFVVLIITNLFLVTSVFPQTIRPEKVVKAIYSDKSEELRNIPIVSPELRDRSWKDGVVKNKHGFHEDFKRPSFWTGKDPVLQDQMSAERSTPVIYENFPGIGNLSGVVPPDPDGDVGPNHYFQMVNLAFAIWDKNGNMLYGPADNSTLWDGFDGPWSGTNNGDPIVVYDEYADRWVASQFALPNYPNGPFYELVAVSETGDPTGAWYRYAFEFSNMPDYPKFGVWSDGYYFTVNQFAPPYLSWAGAGVCVLNRDAMLTGDPNAEMIFFNLGSSYSSLLPADCDGSTLPPAGTSSYFAETTTSTLRIWEADIDWNNTNNSSVSIAHNLPVQSYSHSGITINQPGTSTTLMEISDRLMYRLQYRNFGSYQVMLTNHTVNADGNGQAGVRWYELRNYGSGWSIHQQGTYAPDDGENRWMASIAMNGDGDIALGYSVSSSSTYPSIRFAGQNAESSGTGILDIPETSIKEGTASQTGINRWGDYSSMTIDPGDDETFWYTTEYTTGGWNWKTQIASFSYAPIVDPPIADFNADDTHPMEDQTVEFMDMSSNVPGTWNWSFSPSTVSFVEGTNSGSKNPKVQFNSAGFYTVTLIATNDIGTDTETKTDYINTLDCSPITSYPYLQTFNEWAESTPVMACTSDGNVVLDDCWVNTTGDYIDWDILSENTGSPETGPVDDHGGGGNYLYTESSSCYNHDAFMQSPAFNLTVISNPELRFWYHMYGSTMGTLSVQVSTNGGTSWSSDIWSLSGDQGNSWQEAIISLGSYGSSSNVKLRFVGLTGSSWYSDMAIDDISVDGSSGSAVTANAGADQEICENGYGQLNGTVYNSASVVWSSSGDGNFNDVNDLNAEYTLGNNDQNNGSAIITLTAYPIPPTTGTATDQMTLSIQQEPTADAGSDANTCAGVSYTISGASSSNSSSILWTEDGTGSLSGATTLTPTYTPGSGETGNVILTLTVSGQGDCSDAVSAMTLNIQNGATADAGTDASICEGNTYTVTDAAANDYADLLWTTNGTGNISSATTLSPIYEPGTDETGTVTLTLTASGQGSCGDAESTMELEIFGEPIADAGSDANTCAGVSYTISGASSSNSSSILWTEDGTGSLSGATTLTPTYTPGSGETGNVILTLTVSGQGDCSDAVSAMTLNIQNGATADAGTDASICEGNTYTVTDAAANDYADLLWTTNGTGNISSATTLSPIYEPGTDETGTVTLTLTASGQSSCGDAESTMELEIFGEPTADAGSDANTCAGVSYTISGASSSNSSSILWTEDGTGSLSGATTLTPTYTPGSGETGNVILTLTVSGQGDCSDAVSAMTLNIIGGTTAYAGADATTCEESAYTINDASATNYSSLVWTTNGSGTLIDETTISPTYIPADEETGDVILTLTVTSGGNGMCGTDNSSMILTIIPGAVADAGPGGETCENSSFTVSGASASDNSTCEWSTTGNGVLTGITTLTPTYTPASGESGEIYLTLTVTSGGGNCGSTSSNTSLYIYPTPYANAGQDDNTCQGDSYTVADATASSNSTYLWTTDGMGALCDETTLFPTYTPGADENGMVSLTLTVSSDGGMCGEVTSSMMLEIIPGASAYAGQDGSTCISESYTVSGATASSNNTMLWATDGSGILSGETTLTPTYTPGTSEIGEITLTLTVTSAGGGVCGEAVSEMILTIYPETVVSAGSNMSICENNYVQLNASALNYSLIEWCSSGDGYFDDENALSAIYYPGNNDIISDQLTLTLNAYSLACNMASDNLEVFISPMPFADAGEDDESCDDETYQLSGYAENKETTLWTSTGDGSFNDPTILNPVYTPGTSDIFNGEVQLSLTSFGTGACDLEVTDEMVLAIKICTSVRSNVEPVVEFKIMPNPANEYVKFTVDNLNSKYADVSLINMVGGVIRAEKYDVIDGSTAGRFVLVGLDQGVYYIRIISDKYYNAARLIKLK